MESHLTYSKAFRDEVIALKECGVKVKDIRTQMGISTYTLYKILHTAEGTWKGYTSRERTLHSFTCEQCGEVFQTRKRPGNRNRFCSTECFAASRKGKPVLTPEQAQETGKRRRKRMECICMECGTSFPKRPSEVHGGRGRFCSRECSGRYYGVRNENPFHGRYNGIPASDTFKILYSLEFLTTRRKAKERDKVCQFCGKDGRLIAHHIIPRQAHQSDKVDDLVSLCYRCHRNVSHMYLIRIVAEEIQSLLNPPQDGEPVVSIDTGNAALKPAGNSGKRPSTDHSLSAQSEHMARMARERVLFLSSLNGGHGILNAILGACEGIVSPR